MFLHVLNFWENLRIKVQIFVELAVNLVPKLNLFTILIPQTS